MNNALQEFQVLNKQLSKEIDKIISAYNNDESRLIDILLEIQDIVPNRYLPEEVAEYVSLKLSLPIARVFDVISFYAAFSPSPRAKNIIEICDSVACNVTGNSVLKDTIKDILGINPQQATEDRNFFLAYTPCFGACDISPAMRVNGMVYGNLDTPEKINEIINKYK